MSSLEQQEKRVHSFTRSSKTDGLVCSTSLMYGEAPSLAYPLHPCCFCFLGNQWAILRCVYCRHQKTLQVTTLTSLLVKKLEAVVNNADQADNASSFSTLHGKKWFTGVIGSKHLRTGTRCCNLLIPLTCTILNSVVLLYRPVNVAFWALHRDQDSNPKPGIVSPNSPER